MRIFGLSALLLLVTSCTYKTYNPLGLFWFSFENSNKVELMKILDEFAASEGFTKKQDGGENLIPEVKAVRVLAAYSTANEYQFQVENILNEKCFSGAAYDFGEHGADKARLISTRLQAHLKNKLNRRLSFYADQYCKAPSNK